MTYVKLSKSITNKNGDTFKVKGTPGYHMYFECLLPAILQSCGKKSLVQRRAVLFSFPPLFHQDTANTMKICPELVTCYENYYPKLGQENEQLS